MMSETNFIFFENQPKALDKIEKKKLEKIRQIFGKKNRVAVFLKMLSVFYFKTQVEWSPCTLPKIITNNMR